MSKSFPSVQSLPGLFVVFEGNECSGKTTIVDYVCSELTRLQVSFTRVREPGGTPMSDSIRSTLIHDWTYSETVSPVTQMLLFAAARVQNINNNIVPNLRKNKHVVICDRFKYSTMAIQGLSDNRVDEVRELHRFIGVDTFDADLLFHVHASNETIIRRLHNSCRQTQNNAFEARGTRWILNMQKYYQQVMFDIKHSKEGITRVIDFLNEDTETLVPDVSVIIDEVLANL